MIETTVAMRVSRAIAVPAQANVREFCAVDLASSWESTELARIARSSSFCCSSVSRSCATSSGVAAGLTLPAAV